MKSGLLLAAATFALLVGGATSASAAWNFVTIQDPSDASNTVASGINNSGFIVGTYLDGSAVSHGFTKSGPTYTTVDVSGSSGTTASGVNNAGTITGYFTDGTGTHGFTQTGVTQTPFNDPSAATGSTFGSATNGSGTTAGFYFDGIGAEHSFTKVGNAYTNFDVTLAGANSTEARGINASGIVVGSYSASGATHGFVKNGASFTQIDDPLGVNGTVVTSIDSAGDLGGYYIDGGAFTHGFVDLNGTFYTVDEPNADAAGGTQVLGINDRLQIVGTFGSAGVISGFSADVPEPGTLALFGLGALGVATLRRRRATLTAA